MFRSKTKKKKENQRLQQAASRMDLTGKNRNRENLYCFSALLPSCGISFLVTWMWKTGEMRKKLQAAPEFQWKGLSIGYTISRSPGRNRIWDFTKRLLTKQVAIFCWTFFLYMGITDAGFKCNKRLLVNNVRLLRNKPARTSVQNSSCRPCNWRQFNISLMDRDQHCKSNQKTDQHTF